MAAIRLRRAGFALCALPAFAAGVEVRDRKSETTAVVSCSERPRFSIHELQGIIPCDPETPVGPACIK